MNILSETRKDFFNRRAERWNEHLSSDDSGYLQKIISIVETPGEIGKNVLDLGCGTGVLFPFLSEWNVTAFDHSESMLKCAKEKQYSNVREYIQGDAHQLPFSDETFARVYMLSVVPHLEDVPDVVAEVRRVLKPGGTVSIIHLLNAETITTIHAKIGGAVAHDRLLEISELKSILLTLKFEVGFEDSNARMTLIGRKL
ncbi:MAG TPA: methyltransferase domain-containing protein [Bacteroidota bacterium]|nr:methyltransferase domain-containing protein [Bacteroidota bacterium]